MNEAETLPLTAEEREGLRELSTDEMACTPDDTAALGKALGRLEQLERRSAALDTFWRAREAALGTPNRSPEWQAFAAARAALYGLLEREASGEPAQPPAAADELARLRVLVADERSWRGGYELTGAAGEALFRALGLVPRCRPAL